jgi:ATP-dependent helicase/nuclease subunit A
VREAETVVNLIRQARREDPEGTVAILVRARTHLPAIVDQLKNASLSFRAVEIDELSERAVVRDLLSLTRALLHPGDRLSWLAILRAPWCGLTLADLHALAATDQRAFIYDLLRGDLSALTRDGRQRTARFMGVIEAAFASRGRVPLRTWVERTWQDLGGPSCAEDPAASQDAADYLDLLEREQSGCDLPDFDAFAGRVGKLKAQADPTANEWLQVMTIHKAKGLQFDTVILPGLGRQARRDDSRMFLFHRGLVAPIKESAAEFDPIYAYLAELEKRRGKHEIVRQLYVAATRARKSLHLMGSVKVYTKGVKPISGSLLSALWAGMTIEERQLFIDQAAIPPAGSSQAKPQPPLRRLPEGWVAPPPPKPLEITASGPEINELEQPTFEWVGDSLRYAGTVVHELLQRLAKTGLTQIDPAVVRRALSQLGVPPAELDRAAVQVEAAISRTLSSPKGRWILATHRQARSEMSVAGVVDGKIVRGTVDRTFIDDRGIRWVIDFKTSAHQGGGVAEFLDEQQRRYRAQMERYARLLAPMGQPVRLGLYFPLLDKWREWAMEWSEWLWATD